MGTKYTSQSATGFNASPPPDDGSTTASNKITWNSTILAKIGTPLSNFITAVNSALVNAFNYAFSLNTTTYTTVAADNCTVIENTGSNTVSLGDAATMGGGYIVGVKNTGTGLTTVALITAANTLDGVSNGTITVPPKQCVFFAVNQAVNGYDIIAGNNSDRQGADIASASTIVLDNYDGNYVHVTGTVTITAITLGKGAERTVEFTGILTLTNGASLILPGGANITTAAGDTAIFRGEASGVVRCIGYFPTSGRAVVIPVIATEVDQETGTSLTVTVTPGRQQFHPSAAKAFVQFTVSGSTVTVNRSYNVTSVGRNSTGDYTVNFTTNFSDAFYSFSVSGDPVTNGTSVCYPMKKNGGTYSVSAFQIAMSISGGGAGGSVEATTVSAIFFGDQ